MGIHRREFCVFKSKRGSPQRAELSEEEGSNLPVAWSGAETERQVSFYLGGGCLRFQVTSKSRLANNPSMSGFAQPPKCVCLNRRKKKKINLAKVRREACMWKGRTFPDKPSRSGWETAPHCTHLWFKVLQELLGWTNPCSWWLP